ncbi:MAG: hypothetical protein LKK27_05065 [Eubacterium sp.]|jgi:hypothetical protein|nr:hypothetical protein [Eubacterium sp.]
MCDVAQRLEDRGRVSGLQEGIKEGGLIMLYRLVSEGTITIDQAVNAALPYGVKNAEDFRKRAMIAGYHLKLADIRGQNRKSLPGSQAGKAGIFLCSSSCLLLCLGKIC